MLPLLKQGRDLFIVKKKTQNRCKKYDVVLFKRADNKYVLHRIIKVNKDDYTIRGDNCVNKEYGVTDENILGVMTSFIRKGKEYTVENKLYKIYSVLWCKLYFLRKLYQKLSSKEVIK
ncbi:MAG: S24/S26 family peptidase [Acutalibacteraceae bacterium]|nr:S24/S26 family peptidase [Acutalibacteraceae bacterium]